MAIQFQHNYQLLELDPSSDWETANKNYRRLVHVWHPDRFEQRPRERVHAQQQFIELTKAFNNLRAFYRENNRMPLQPMKQAVADAPEPPPHQRIVSDDELTLQSGILNKRKPSQKTIKPSILRPLLWALPIGATVLTGLIVFVVIDRNAKMHSIEEAKRVLRDTQPSKYMADSDKISQANSRAALIHRSDGDGKLEVKLTRDLFK